MKKRLWLFMAAVLAIISISGCSGGVSEGNGGIKALLILNQMDTFRQTLVDAAKNKAQQEGVQLDVLDAEGSIEKEVAYIKDAVKKGYDVILCIPVNADTVLELKATAEDIPIVFMNNCPDRKHLEKGKYIYAGSSERVSGQYQAEYLLDYFAGKNEINVVIIEGEKGHSATIGRKEGLKKTLSESGRQVHYVFDDYADWDQEKARALMEVFFKTGAPVDCIVCQNDAMALGAMEACREAGVDLSQVPVLGIDATADGCAAIEKGEMAFTVYQSGKGQGEAAMEAGIKLAKGEPLDSMEGISEDGLYVWVPFEKVDKGNVGDYQSQ